MDIQNESGLTVTKLMSLEQIKKEFNFSDEQIKNLKESLDSNRERLIKEKIKYKKYEYNK